MIKAFLTHFTNKYTGIVIDYPILAIKIGIFCVI